MQGLSQPYTLEGHHGICSWNVHLFAFCEAVTDAQAGARCEAPLLWLQSRSAILDAGLTTEGDFI